jgi:hypothetical protein
MRRLVVAATNLTILGFLVSEALAGSPGSCERTCCDMTPPTVQIDKRSDGTTITGLADVNGTANDNVKVARIELSVDSDRFQRAHEATAWTYSLDSATLTNGLH